ncbi:hypothetical protein [Janthinobacterium sp. RB2P8]|uniref:hypothetical protein n=1 Tax=Janthinobacterium sp. RB2P8 TaxID=3424191 RepID=UPI003F215AD6
MSEKSNSSQPQSKSRPYLVKLFQVFIVICLIDGFLDIAYPLAMFTKKKIKIVTSEIKNSAPMELNESQKVIIPAGGLPLRNEPGIRNIVSEYHSTSINVNATGLRYNGQPPPEKVGYVGVLLGSSTAFGYGVADNQTIAAHLERALNHTRIYNYAGLGQPLPDNILRWYDLQKNNGKPDFVILAGVNYQLLDDCRPIWTTNIPGSTHSNIFLYLTDKLSNEKIMPCTSSDSIELAVRNSILSIENAVTFARKNRIPFYIVNLPSPFDANVNISNILNSANTTYYMSMRRVVSHYHQELTKLDIPEFIDLSHALPADKTYFIDMGGHLSKEGNRLISEKIFDHIWGNKSQVATRLPQH